MVFKFCTSMQKYFKASYVDYYIVYFLVQYSSVRIITKTVLERERTFSYLRLRLIDGNQAFSG